jgi:hypothetical protein
MSDMSPAEQIEFASNVKTLATNGTLWKLFEMIEEEQTRLWKSSPATDRREECWHVLQGIQLLRTKIESFNNEDKVRAWQVAHMQRRI